VPNKPGSRVHHRFFPLTFGQFFDVFSKWSAPPNVLQNFKKSAKNIDLNFHLIKTKLPC